MYAWSVLSTPIAAEFTGWTKAQLSLTFTLVMILFCIGSLLCGLLAGKLSAKNAVRLGAVLFLAGFYIASRCQTPLTLYLGFGVLCGLGSGLSYNAVMSTMVKWFPDKPGLISGVLLMGFGGGSFLIGKLYQAWTPIGIGGWRTSFVVLGIVCFAVLAVCSFFFVAPGADFAAPAGKGGKAAVRPAAADIKPVEMLKKPTFWLYYVWAIAVSAAGLALISQASGVVWEASADQTAASVATIVGLISICNALGRCCSAVCTTSTAAACLCSWSTVCSSSPPWCCCWPCPAAAWRWSSRASCWAVWPIPASRPPTPPSAAPISAPPTIR